MNNNPIAHLDDDQISVIKYGLSLIPKIQQAIPELRYSTKSKTNNIISKLTLEQFESGKIEKLTPDQFKIVLLALNGLYLILIKDIFIDVESTSFAEKNSQNIRLLQALMDTHNPNVI